MIKIFNCKIILKGRTLIIKKILDNKIVQNVTECEMSTCKIMGELENFVSKVGKGRV